MSYVSLAILTRARSNRLAALSVRHAGAPKPRQHDTITNVFADID